MLKVQKCKTTMAWVKKQWRDRLSGFIEPQSIQSLILSVWKGFDARALFGFVCSFLNSVCYLGSNDIRLGNSVQIIFLIHLKENFLFNLGATEIYSSEFIKIVYGLCITTKLKIKFQIDRKSRGTTILIPHSNHYENQFLMSLFRSS